MRIEVMRGHTNSLDANDKLIQTRSYERDTAASRKRQVVMRKGKSTIDGTRCEELHFVFNPNFILCDTNFSKDHFAFVSF